MSWTDRLKSALSPRHEKVTDLLESPRTKTVHIEFTSLCNLRCVFCFVSQPDYKGANLDAEMMENIIRSLKLRKPEVVSVNGHGETTTYKNWDLYCDHMLAAGMSLHIISNFSKEFSRKELETLSQFQSIEISCDSDDPELFKKLRRGADLRTVALNILKLRTIALKENRKGPLISFSCVVSDKNILHLEEYVAFGKALGVGHFNFCNLTKYPDLPGTLNPKHVTEMPLHRLEEAETALTSAFRFLRKARIKFHVQQGLPDTLRQKIKELKSTLSMKGDNSGGYLIENAATVEKEAVPQNEMPHPQRYSSARPVSQTRDCLEPWRFLQVQANKDVLPCCWHQPIHSLGIGQSLTGVFNNTRIKELRRRLLSGDLSPDCMNCPSRGWTTTGKLKKKVWRYINPGIHGLLPARVPAVKPEVLQSFKLDYLEGWYEPENNPGIPNPDWQSWRWTAGRAVCRLENTGKKALLVIRGAVNKSVYKEQKITVKLNGTLLDSFFPGTARFCKEYEVAPGTMGEEGTCSLIFETDKVFTPSALDPGNADNRKLGIQIYYLFFGEKMLKGFFTSG